MIVFLSICMIGMIVGYKAAEIRGFSLWAGVLGGALLGILSPLMFFCSGVSKSNENKKCPNCLEQVKSEAKICKHCRSSL